MAFRDWLARQLQGIGSGIYTSETWRIPPSKSVEDFLKAYGEVGWLFAVTSKIAQSVASSKWRVYEKGADDELKEVRSTHPAVQLLSMVNPFWTSLDLFELHQLYMDLAGESFWYILRDGARRPRSIWLLPPHKVDVIPSSNLDEFVAGYIFRTSMGEPVPLSTDEIIHIKLPNPLNVHRGLGPVQAAMLDADTDKFVATYLRNYFFNNAQPGGFITTKAGYSKEEHDRLIEMFEKRHQGPAAAGRIGVLWGEMDYKSVEVSARELQLVATKNMTRNNILGIYGVPLPVMGITEDVNRANAEAGFYVYMKDVITPRLTRIAVYLTEFFLPAFGANLVMAFDNVIPEDKAVQRSDAVSGYLGGLATFNEGRSMYGFDEVEGGDFVLMPGISPTPVPLKAIEESVKLEGEAESEEEPDIDLDDDSGDDEGDEGDDDGDVVLGNMRIRGKQYSGRWYVRKKRKALEDVIEVVDDPHVVEVEETRSNVDLFEKRGEEFHRGMQMALGKIEGHWSRELREELNLLVDEVTVSLEQLTAAPKRDITDVLAKWAAHDGRIEVILRNAGTQGFNEGGAFAASFVGTSFKLRKEEAEQWALANAAQKVKGISATTRKQLRDVIEEGLSKGQSVQDVAKAVKRVMPGHNAVRSKVIARTELQEASQVGSQEQYRADGIEKNQWYTALDERVCPICAPLHGEIVPIGEKFSGGYTRPPQTHPQCRCDLLPVVQDEAIGDDEREADEGQKGTDDLAGECSIIDTLTGESDERGPKREKRLVCGFKGIGIKERGEYIDFKKYDEHAKRMRDRLEQLGMSEKGFSLLKKLISGHTTGTGKNVKLMADWVSFTRGKGGGRFKEMQPYRKHTQQVLKALMGDKRKITLYRGMDGDAWRDRVDKQRAKGKLTFKLNYEGSKYQYSSWSIDPAIAEDFAWDPGYVVKAVFKVKDVVATALTSPNWGDAGYLREMEVVMRHKNKVKVMLALKRPFNLGLEDIRQDEPDDDTFDVPEDQLTFGQLHRNRRSEGDAQA